MITEQALIRAELPGNTVKRLARLIDVPVDTARHWLYKHFPCYRRPEVALVLIGEHLKENEARKARFKRLCEMAGLPNEVEILGNVGEDPWGDRILGFAGVVETLRRAAQAKADEAEPE